MARRWKKSDGVLVADLEDEVVLLVAGTREMHTLNETGRVVWSRLEQGLDDVVAAICDEFDVDPETARSDALELLDDLTAAGLVDEA